MAREMIMKAVEGMAGESDVAIRVTFNGEESVQKVEETVECHRKHQAVVESARVNTMITTLGILRETAEVTADCEKHPIEVEGIAR